jgi:hypothetical protein
MQKNSRQGAIANIINHLADCENPKHIKRSPVPDVH